MSYEFKTILERARVLEMAYSAILNTAFLSLSRWSVEYHAVDCAFYITWRDFQYHDQLGRLQPILVKILHSTRAFSETTLHLARRGRKTTHPTLALKVRKFPNPAARKTSSF